ncbi:MAG TPA: dihydroxyacetone kinase subunit DhaL [Mycobacteriales bacterium]|nr:dihydroxyacetone kinase subunit DhaL [Mycobacteriales bacterium]
MPVDAALVRAWVTGFAESVSAAKTELTRLDQAIGDGDHGANMTRGLTAAVEKLSGDTPGDLLKGVGRTLISTVGGASGPLYGTAFREAGKALGDADPASDTDFAAALRAGLDGIIRLGKAEPGDKTMVDAWTPALSALEDELGSGGDLAQAAAAASRAAAEGTEATTPMQARKGRASYLGPRSVGHQDPGATSTTLLFEALAKVTG